MGRTRRSGWSRVLITLASCTRQVGYLVFLTGSWTPVGHDHRLRVVGGDGTLGVSKQEHYGYCSAGRRFPVQIACLHLLRGKHLVRQQRVVGMVAVYPNSCQSCRCIPHGCNGNQQRGSEAVRVWKG